MGNVIQWADYVKALNAITKEQQAVSGMSVSEAANALKFTRTASGMYVKTVMSTTAVESTVATTATEAASAIAVEGASTTAVNLTLVEGAGGTAEVMGLGTIAAPIAACLSGAVGGYLIGKELNKNPAYSTFFDNLVFRTLDFVTGNHFADELINENNAPTVPILYDANGRAYLASDMINGVKTYLDSLGATGISDHLVSTALALVGSYPYYIILQSTGTRGNSYTLLFSDNKFAWWYYAGEVDCVQPYKNGVSVTTGGYNCASYDGHPEWTTPNHFGGTGITPVSQLPNKLTFLYANHDIYVINATGSTPTTVTNTIKFNAKVPMTIPTPITKYTPSTTLVTNPKTDPNGKVWKEVFLPSTAPTEMPDGQPVPETAPDPARVNPYIKPYQPQPVGVPIKIPSTTPTNPLVIPDPEPDISTAPYPAPNPASDPSAVTDPISLPVQEPIPDPIDTGTPVVPVVPSVPAPSSAKGLLHVYNPTATQVDQFGEWLWTTFSGDIIDTIGKLFNNPMDAVIGLHEIYCTPTESATDVNIRAGFLESNVPSRLVTSRYVEIKCGAISVPEYWCNYLDYSPYTKSYCYLPFIGIVELNTDDIVGSGVEITYRVDVYNGSCIALITTAKPNSAESVTYQFEGNCAVSVPITSGMMSSIQNALIGVATTALSAGATAAVTVATGGTALPAAVLAGSVAAGATKQGLTSKNQVQYSGSFGSSYGAMGLKKPFLIIKRPRQKVVYGYNDNYGYPSHKMVLISTCTGYLRVKEVDVISPTATEAEKKMIENLLKTGVFVD
jgi:hypothetical protein